MNGGIQFTEPLPSNDRRDTHTDTQTEGFMKYVVEMGSSVMTYIPNFIKIGSGIRKLIGGYSQTHRQHEDRITLFSFFEIRESRLKTGTITS
jgi:hypothetical protein